MSEYLDRLLTREASLSPIVILFCPLEISPEAETNADKLFDKCRNFEGVATDRCSISDCRGPDVNCEDLSSSWEELVDIKGAVFCVSSVAMGTDVSGV